MKSKRDGYEEMDRFMEKEDRAKGVRSVVTIRKEKNRQIGIGCLSSMWDWVDKDEVRRFRSNLGG